MRLSRINLPYCDKYWLGPTPVSQRLDTSIERLLHGELVALSWQVFNEVIILAIQSELTHGRVPETTYTSVTPEMRSFTQQWEVDWLQNVAVADSNSFDLWESAGLFMDITTDDWRVKLKCGLFWQPVLVISWPFRPKEPVWCRSSVAATWAYKNITSSWRQCEMHGDSND